MSTRVRSCFLFLGVLALPAATMFLVSSCTLINEPTSGLTAKGGSSCARVCREDYRSDQAECDRVLRIDIRTCRQLPAGPERDACFAAATSKYTACQDAAAAVYEDCLAGCHTQGGGTVN